MARTARATPRRFGFALVAVSVVLFILSLGLAFTVYALATALLAILCLIFGVVLLSRPD